MVTALHLSKTIFGTIRANFFWALIYNVVMLPLAAGAFFPILHRTLPPAMAAASMSLSSVGVLLSSLRLKWYVAPKLGVSFTLDDPELYTPAGSSVRPWSPETPPQRKTAAPTENSPLMPS